MLIKLMKSDIYPKVNNTYLKKKVNDKEYFKIIIEYLNKYKEDLHLVDIGCASGDFLKILSNKKKFSLTGIDFSKDSLNIAKKRVPGANFILKDLKKKINLSKKFDICTCLGTLAAFDNKFKIINKLINIVKKNGELIIFDPINEHDVNVLVRYQNNFEKNTQWRSGFNTFSKNYWTQKLKENLKIKSFSFEKFNIKKNIPRTLKNPMRTWTIKSKNYNQIMVGTGQLINYYIIKIKLK